MSLLDGPSRFPQGWCLGDGCPNGAGCPNCCYECDTDAHTCPGCGTAIGHAIGICLRCRNPHP